MVEIKRCILYFIKTGASWDTTAENANATKNIFLKIWVIIIEYT